MPKAPAKPKGARVRKAAREAGDLAADGAEAYTQAEAARQAGSTGATSPPPAEPPAGTAASLSAGAPAGPWFTCGLGGQLLAQSAVGFAFAVALSYAAGGYVLWLLVSLLAWLLCPGSCSFTLEPCSTGNQPGPCCGGPCNGSASGSGGGGCCGGSGSASGSGSCCGSEPSQAGSVTVGGKGTPEPVLAPLAGLGAAAWLRPRAALDRLFAHHPPGPAFAADTYRIAGARLCVGCFTTYPAFLAASAWLALSAAAPAGAWLLAVGLPLAAVQAVSSLGWARSRRAKAAVKASLGLGLALAVHGILTSAWPRPLQAGALFGLLALAWLSALPRRRRIAAAAPAPAPRA